MVQIGVVHRHYKGGRYLPVGLVRNSERRDQQLVVYVSLDRGTGWARPLKTPGEDSWEDPITWPDGIVRARFTLDANITEEAKLAMAWKWGEYDVGRMKSHV